MDTLTVVAGLVVLVLLILGIRLIFKLATGTLGVVLGVILAIPLTIIMLPVTIYRAFKQPHQR